MDNHYEQLIKQTRETKIGRQTDEERACVKLLD
jgi:hypothetical protein